MKRLLTALMMAAGVLIAHGEESEVQSGESAPAICSITFDPNADGVWGAMAAQQVVSNQISILQANRFVRPGWTFAGWSENKGATKVQYEDGGASGKMSADLALYAIWSTNRNVIVRSVGSAVTNDLGTIGLAQGRSALWVVGTLSNQTDRIAFKVSGGSGPLRVAIDPLQGERVKVEANVLKASTEPTDPNQNINGYKAYTNVTDVSNGEVTIANGTYLVEISRSGLQGAYPYVFSVNAQGHDLAFAYNGGAAAPKMSYYGQIDGSNFNFTVGLPVGYVPAATNENAKSFSGWFTDAAVGTKADETTLVSSGMSGTLYARWYYGPYEYTVEYEKNLEGATNAMAKSTFHSDATNRLPLCTFGLKHYEFIGWSTSAAGAVEYVDGATFFEPMTAISNGTVTLYAQWEDHRPTFTNEVGGIDWKYVVEDGVGATIVNNASEAGEPAISRYVSGAVKVPETLLDEASNVVNVVAIGANAFSGCAKITSIGLPASVTAIDEAAFRNCTSLKRVTFGHDHALASIPARCFEGCAALASIDLPYSIAEVGDRAFAGCTTLKDITIPEHVESMGSFAFTNCPNLKIVRYWGKEPTADEDELYAGAYKGLVSGVVPIMWSGASSISSNDSTWCARKLAALNASSSPALRRMRFDANYVRGGVTTNMCIRGHVLFELPEDPERASEDLGVDDNYSVDYDFLGWFTKKTGGEEVSSDWIVDDARTFYAQWDVTVGSSLEGDTPDLHPAETVDANPLSTTAACTAMAVVFDEADDVLKGTVTFSLGKGVSSNGIVRSVVKATAVADGFKRTFAGTMLNALPVRLVNVADDEDVMDVTFTENGVAGHWGDWKIEGARDGISTKGDWMREDYLRRYAGRDWNLVWCETNENAGAISVATNAIVRLSALTDGNVKVSGTVAGETLATSVRLILGVGTAYVPVQCTLTKGKNAGGTLMLWLELKSDSDWSDSGKDPSMGLDSMEVTILSRSARYFSPKGTLAELGGLDGVEEVLRDLGRLSFATSAIVVKESAAFAEISVKRLGGDKGTSAHLGYRTLSGTNFTGVVAANAQGLPYEEYYPTNGVISWWAGDTSTKTIRVRLVPDEYPTYEVDKVFGVEVAPLCTGYEEVNSTSFWSSAANVDTPHATWIGTNVCTITVKETDKRRPGTIAAVGYMIDDTEEADTTPIANVRNPVVKVTAAERLSLVFARTGGADGRVAVKISDVKGTARPEEDYDWEGEEDPILVWEDGVTSNQTVTIATYRQEGYASSKSFALKLAAVSGGGYVKPQVAASSVAVTIRNDTVAQTLEEYAKALPADARIAIKGGKSGQWYVESEDELEGDVDEEVTLNSVPLAAGKSQSLTFTLTGPGLFALTPPDEPEATTTVTFGKEKWKSTEEDWPSSVTRVMPAGKTTVTVTVKADKNGEGLDVGTEVSWSWIPFGTVAPLPANGSVVTEEQVLSWDFTNRDTAETAGLVCKLVVGASKDKLTKSAEFGDEFDSPDDVKDSLSEMLEACVPGRTYYWRLAFGTGTEDEDEITHWQWNKDVWSFTVAKDGAPKTRFVFEDDIAEESGNVGESEGEKEDDGSDLALALVQGVKARYQLGSDTEGVTYKVLAGKLPDGLKLNAKTGVVSGVPTKAGTFTTVFQALAGKVGGTTVAAHFAVAKLGTGAGTFSAVMQSEEEALTNAAALASVTFTASSVGKLSAKVLRGGKSHVFTATGYDSFVESPIGETDTESAYELVATLLNIEKNKSGNITNTLAVTVYAGSATNLTVAGQTGVAEVRFKAGSDGEELLKSERFIRDNSKLTGWGNDVASFAGYHTIAMLPPDDPGTAPQGHGYLSATVSKGTVKYAVVHADGTSGSGSVVGGLVNDDNGSPNNFLVPLYAYKAKAVFGGTLVFAISDANDDEVESDVAEVTMVPVVDSVESSLFRANDDPASTEDGLEGYALSLTPVGGWFDTVVNVQGHYAKCEMALDDAIEVDASEAAQVLMEDDSAVGAIRDVTCSLKPATGLVSGTFDLYGIDDTARAVKLTTVKHKGVVVLNSDGTWGGDVVSYGFFLVPKTFGSGKSKRTWNGSWAFDVTATARDLEDE